MRCTECKDWNEPCYECAVKASQSDSPNPVKEIEVNIDEIFICDEVTK